MEFNKMSEGRKKNRKSKLEVRQDCDYEQQSEPDLQRYLKLLRADHDYISTKVPEPIQLSIKVEVEEFEPDSIPFDIPSESPSTSSMALDEDMIKTCYQHVSTLKRYGNRGLCKKITFSMERILQAAEHTVSIAPTIPNMILNICLRNLLGSYTVEEYVEEPHDKLIKNALLNWPSWCKVTNIKDTPLFYQCYICNMSWWHFYPFREHIKKHNIKTLNISFEYEKTVCYVVATDSTDTVTITYMPTEGECYRCGNGIEYHIKNKDAYKCEHCGKKFSSCSVYKIHEGQCLNLKNEELKFCIICNSYISANDVNQHFLRTHIVRSDMPVPIINRTCSLCKQVYHHFATHPCPKSGMNAQCGSCKRKFATRKLAEHHDKTNLSNIACELCNTVMAKKCLQMSHMLMHTDLFKLVYKCVCCNELFVDEDSIRLHRIHKHRQKSDRRRCMQLSIPVPERCTREDALETIDYTRPKHKSDISTDTIRKKSKTKKVKKINHNSIALYSDDENGEDWSNDVIEESTSHDGPREDSSHDRPGENSSHAGPKEGSSNYNELRKLLGKDNGESSSKNRKIDEIFTNKHNISKEPSNIEYDDEKSNMSIFEEDVDENPSQVKVGNSSTSVNDEQISHNMEVTVETEPIDNEVLSNVFQVSPELANYSKVFQASKNFEAESSVIIKTEPIDEIDIQEHNLDFQIDKSKSISQNDVQYAPDDYFSVGVTVKEEIFNQFEKENLIIKSEPIDSDEYYVNDETTENSPDFSIDFKKEPNEDDVRDTSDFPDIKEEYYTPEVTYGESNDESDEVVKLNVDKPYPCSKCNDGFKSCRDYLSHLRIIHALPKSICPCCGDKVEKIYKLVPHFERHVRQSFVRMKCLSRSYKSFKCINSCRVCHKTVPKQDIFKHWEKHAYVNNMQFEPRTFKQEYEFGDITDRKMAPEMLAKTLQQLLSSNDCKVCCVCQRKFSRRPDTKRHLIQHLLSDAHVKREVTKTLRCQQCFEDFHKPEHYKFHMRDHGGLTIYRCEICQKTFSDSSNFAKHSKVHNVSVLICDICKKKFNAKIGLERHMIMVHQSAVEEYPCNICNVPCYSSLQRKRHRMKYHTGPAYKCHMCNTVFNTLKSKWDHEWIIHKFRKYKADCPICFKSFRKVSDVKRHAKQTHSKCIRLKKLET